MIKSHHWPQIEFFSSKGQESHHLSWLSNNLSPWELIWDSSGQGKDTWSSSSLFSWQIHFPLYFTNYGVLVCVIERCTYVWSKIWVQIFGSEVTSYQLMAGTLLGVYTDLLMSRGTRFLQGNRPRWIKHVDGTLLFWPNFLVSLTIS